MRSAFISLPHPTPSTRVILRATLNITQESSISGIFKGRNFPRDCIGKTICSAVQLISLSPKPPSKRSKSFILSNERRLASAQSLSLKPLGPAPSMGTSQLISLTKWRIPSISSHCSFPGNWIPGLPFPAFPKPSLGSSQSLTLSSGNTSSLYLSGIWSLTLQ